MSEAYLRILEVEDYKSYIQVNDLTELELRSLLQMKTLTNDSDTFPVRLGTMEKYFFMEPNLSNFLSLVGVVGLNRIYKVSSGKEPKQLTQDDLYYM